MIGAAISNQPNKTPPLTGSIVRNGGSVLEKVWTPSEYRNLRGIAIMARTKSARLASKRGRPRKEGAREPNGRISRSGIDHGPADIIALDARRRHTGLPADKARDQKAATFVGYLNLLGPSDGLSDQQYEAATNYMGLYVSYLRSIKAPGVVREGDGCMSGEDISEAYEDWVRDTKEAYDHCRNAIQTAQFENRGSNLWAALDICIVEDQWMHHMIGDLRVLCNCLARHFRFA